MTTEGPAALQKPGASAVRTLPGPPLPRIACILSAPLRMTSRHLLRVVVATGMLFTTAHPLSAQRAPDRATLVTRIDSIVAAAMAVKNAGIQIAVVQGRDTILMKGYGIANAEHDIAVLPQTVFKIGSVTKQFTSAAIMQLVEQGKLTLDDTLGKFMPKAPLHWHPVTMRQLLNHTSGIPSLTDVGPKVRSALVMGMKRDSIFELLRGDSLMFEPGKGFYYNNTGYYLLGMLVEQLSGKTYSAYLAEMVRPLGLTQTTYCGGPQIITHMAAGYDRQGASLVNTGAVSMETPFSAGSICSTARDLALWAAALAQGRVVKPESYKSMTSPVTLPSAYRMTYGFALQADTMGTRRVVQHGGNINGFSSHLLTVPGDSLYIAVNINVSGAPAGGISADIARLIVGEPRVAVAQKDEPVPAAERAKFMGRYRVGQPNGTRSEITIGEQDDHLTLLPPGGAQPIILQHQGKNVFSVRGQPTQRVLFDMTGNTVTGIVLDRGVRPLMGTKLK